MNWDKIDTRKAIQIQSSIVGKGLRFVGALIDRAFGYVLAMGIFLAIEFIKPGLLDFIVENSALDKLLTLLVLLIYYFTFEFFFQKTIGKFLLRLRVVNEHDGSKPDFATILKRTVSRILSIEALFYLFGNRLWHDNWSDTVVISEKKLAEQTEIDEIGDIGLKTF